MNRLARPRPPAAASEAAGTGGPPDRDNPFPESAVAAGSGPCDPARGHDEDDPPGMTNDDEYEPL